MVKGAYKGLAGVLQNERKSGLSPIPGIRPLSVQGSNSRLASSRNSTMNVIPKSSNTPVIRSFKNGGHVKKTGVYKLHKGEKVLSRKDLDKLAETKLFK